MALWGRGDARKICLFNILLKCRKNLFFGNFQGDRCWILVQWGPPDPFKTLKNRFLAFQIIFRGFFDFKNVFMTKRKPKKSFFRQNLLPSSWKIDFYEIFQLKFTSAGKGRRTIKNGLQICNYWPQISLKRVVFYPFPAKSNFSQKITEISIFQDNNSGFWGEKDAKNFTWTIFSRKFDQNSIEAANLRVKTSQKCCKKDFQSKIWTKLKFPERIKKILRSKYVKNVAKSIFNHKFEHNSILQDFNSKIWTPKLSNLS